MTLRFPTRRLVLLTGLSAIAAPARSRAATATQSIGGPAYGTQWQATIRIGADIERLQSAIEDTLVRIDRLMSPWRPDSDISVFNRSNNTEWKPVNDEVVTVCRSALAIHGASGGAFDPTVGPIVGSWGYGPIEGTPFEKGQTFEAEEGMLRKSAPGLTIDLCGIAKGYALDRIADVLRDHGERNFVIDLGGEIAAFGSHPDGRNWRVAVEDPRPDRTGAAEVVQLEDRAIATSGDKVNGFTLAARRYSHIIDPATAAPVETATASVSVIAADAATADGWATALMAAGADGPAMAEQNGLDALFLLREGSDLRRIPTGRFDDHLA